MSTDRLVKNGLLHTDLFKSIWNTSRSLRTEVRGPVQKGTMSLLGQAGLQVGGIRDGQNQTSHKVFERKRNAPRRKGGWHGLTLLARGHGNSVQRSGSLPAMSSPRYIYGNMAVNPA